MPDSMNSKERVMCAIELQEPDRVPMDFSANETVIQRLKSDLGLNSYRDLVCFLKSDIVDIRGVIDPAYKGPVPFERNLGKGVTENFWGWRTKIKQTATGPERMFCDFVLKQAANIEDLSKHNWPKADWFDFSDMKEKLTDWNDLAVMASGASIWQHPSFLRSLDRLLMDLVLNTEMADFILDRFTDFYIDYFDRMFSACKGFIDILRIADDLGMQDRLLISPDLFDRFLSPRLKKITEMAHSHNVKVMFHSCGSITALIEPLIQAGIDILDPIQVTAAEMEPEYLKRKFGTKLCFHGSIDTQQLLPCGSVDEIINTADKMVKILGKGGGFILAPSHVLQNDVPTENILALYQTEISRVNN